MDKNDDVVYGRLKTWKKSIICRRAKGIEERKGENENESES